MERFVLEQLNIDGRSMELISVEQLYRDKKEYLELSVLTGNSGLSKLVLNNEVHRPGLAMAGFLDRFASQRTQVLGETELAYLVSFDEKQRAEIAERIFGQNLPVVFVTKGLAPPADFLEVAVRHETAVLSSRLTTTEFVSRISTYLDHLFAPQTTIHGTLVDVYGVGLLYTGKSGIGKSECALDLVERGHRLVADDMVRIIRKTPEVIIGTGSELLGHHMEVRGIGIIDIEKLFGIRAIRMQKRIEVEVRLVAWDEEAEYERLGVEDKFTTILGVEIPVVTIPLSPGKNITVISEVIAMNHMLKIYGEHTAQEFSKRLSEEIHRRKMTTTYLESDYE